MAVTMIITKKAKQINLLTIIKIKHNCMKHDPITIKEKLKSFHLSLVEDAKSSDHNTGE